MTTILAIIVTILLTSIIVFVGTIFLMVYDLRGDRNFRNYWRGLIREYSDYDEETEL